VLFFVPLVEVLLYPDSGPWQLPRCVVCCTPPQICLGCSIRSTARQAYSLVSSHHHTPPPQLDYHRPQARKTIVNHHSIVSYHSTQITLEVLIHIHPSELWHDRDLCLSAGSWWWGMSYGTIKFLCISAASWWWCYGASSCNWVDSRWMWNLSWWGESKIQDLLNVALNSGECVIKSKRRWDFTRVYRRTSISGTEKSTDNLPA
jgi:hypothetical protein